MPVERLTYRIFPVAAIDPLDSTDNDPERNRARAELRAEGEIQEQLGQPLPAESTIVTISPEGHEAARLDCQILGPGGRAESERLRLYYETRALK